MKRKSPWFWVPSLYFSEGFPYVMVMTVSIIMFKKMGISNTNIGLWTSLLNLPWVIKPVWGPLIEVFFTKKKWVIACEIAGSIIFFLIALALNLSIFFSVTIFLFLVLAFISATQDIAADGIYIQSLSSKEQAFFVGFRSSFYRIAMLTGQGLMVIIAGVIETNTGIEPIDIAVKVSSKMDNVLFHYPELNISKEEQIVVPTVIEIGKNINEVFIPVSLNQKPNETRSIHFSKERLEYSVEILNGSSLIFDSTNWNKKQYIKVSFLGKDKTGISTFSIGSGDVKLSWEITFMLCSILFFLFAIYHIKYLPRDQAVRQEISSVIHSFLEVFKTFFQKEHIWLTVFFLLTYRFSEAQILKMSSPFFIDPYSLGGLNLSTKEVGMIYGTFGSIALTIGGLAGGIIISRYCLKKVLWLMVTVVNVPSVFYLILSVYQPHSLIFISIAVAIEQFGYGFGFSAYMLYLIYFSKGKYETAHFAIATGLMALGMMLPGMISGYIQSILGYNGFFVWSIIMAIPGITAVFFIMGKINFSEFEN